MHIRFSGCKVTLLNRNKQPILLKLCPNIQLQIFLKILADQFISDSARFSFSGVPMSCQMKSARGVKPIILRRDIIST